MKEKGELLRERYAITSSHYFLQFLTNSEANPDGENKSISCTGNKLGDSFEITNYYLGILCLYDYFYCCFKVKLIYFQC